MKEMEEHCRRAWAECTEEDALYRAQAENRDRAVAVIVEALKGLELEVEGSGPLEVTVDAVKICSS